MKPTVATGVSFKPCERSWTTKSHAELRVPVYLTPEDALAYLGGIDPTHPLRGMRVYMVTGIPREAIGATEYHEQRTEIITVSRGSIQITVEDVYGSTEVHVMNIGDSITIQPYIMHTYLSLEDGTDLVVVANTVFDPEDSSTADSFGREAFAAISENT